MKLWIKIVLLNIIIVVSLGISIGMAIRGAVITSMRAELTRQGVSIAKNLSHRIADPILLNDFYKAQEAIEDVLKTEKDIEYVFVTGKDGYILSHTFKKGYPPDILRWNPVINNLSIQLLDTEKGFIRDVGVRIFGGMKPELHIGIREERIRNTLGRIRNLIITLTIVATIVGSILSFSLSRLITKPLNRLVDFTHDLAKGDFGKTIEIKSRDEVGELARTFNKLSFELDAYRKKMDEAYKQMLRTEKLSALGRLSAGLAHELRTPLTSIKTLFQTFRNDPSSLTGDDMDVVLSAVSQMNDLLTKFLRFARTDDFTLTDVYINSLIKQVIKLTEFHLKDRAIQLSLELSKIPPIKADRAMIQQVLLNLIVNAIEAMPQGGALTVTSKLENGSAVIVIKDTGCGIPEDLKEKVFDPFFTTKEDGTGLGLSIVYNIITIHKGEIGFSSNGEGTTFTVKIPLSV